jgi:hypothetical protein
VEKAALRKGLLSGWYGPMIVTPYALYFISLVEVGPNDIFSYPAIGRGAIGSAWKAREILIAKTEHELKNLGNYIENIDDLVLKKDNSLKINKLDIEKCKIPKRYYLQTGTPTIGVINIKTINEKFEILFQEPKKIIPGLHEFLENNLYPIK